MVLVVMLLLQSALYVGFRYVLSVSELAGRFCRIHALESFISWLKPCAVYVLLDSSLPAMPQYGHLPLWFDEQ